jgi:hypothetical protein
MAFSPEGHSTMSANTKDQLHKLDSGLALLVRLSVRLT